MSSTRIDYVPVLCTHRPSLLPIESFSELEGPISSGTYVKVVEWELKQT